MISAPLPVGVARSDFEIERGEDPEVQEVEIKGRFGGRCLAIEHLLPEALTQLLISRATPVVAFPSSFAPHPNWEILHGAPAPG